MDEDNSIIYLSLSNLELSLIDILENHKEEKSKEELEMLLYLLSKTESLENKYRNLLNNDTKIKRPNW